MTIEDLTRGLSRDEDGIWIAATAAQTRVSYPGDGSDSCLEVEDRSFWFAHRNRCIGALVRRFPPPGPILDVGGGNGVVSRHLLDLGYETILIEPGTAGARNARRRRALPHVIRATLQQLGPAPGSVAAIGLFDVLEHVRDDQGFVADLHRCLRPGGRLYLSVPAFPWLWSGNDVYSGHVRRYTPAMLRKRLTPAFSITFQACLFAPLLIPVMLLRALPFRLHLQRQRSPLSGAGAHGLKGGRAVHILEALLRREAARLERGQGPRLGTSILVAAERVPDQSTAARS